MPAARVAKLAPEASENQQFACLCAGLIVFSSADSPIGNLRAGAGKGIRAWNMHDEKRATSEQQKRVQALLGGIQRSFAQRRVQAGCHESEDSTAPAPSLRPVCSKASRRSNVPLLNVPLLNVPLLNQTLLLVF